MKKHYILSIILFILFFNTSLLYSQVTITEIERSEETIVLKSPPYDSLKKWDNDYPQQYIGLQIYFPPKSTFILNNSDIESSFNENFLFSIKPSTIKNHITYIYKPVIYNINSKSYFVSDSNEVCNHYFTILKIIYDNNLNELLYKMNTTSSAFKLDLGHTSFSDEEGYFINYMLLIRNDKTGDSLYCTNIEKFILVPYFIKQKQIYQKKYLIYDDEIYIHGGKNQNREEYDPRYIVRYIDKNNDETISGKKVELKVGSKWYCKEVTLLKPHYDINYILQNDNDEQIALTNIEGFTLIQDYIKRKADKKLPKQPLISKSKKEDLLKKVTERKVYEKHKKECISKFGQDFGALIAQGKVKIGMTKEMCKYSWGDPLWSNKTTTENVIYDTWYYRLGYSLYFVNGILKVINE